MRQIKTKRDVADGLARLLKLDPRLAPIAAQVTDVPLRLSTPGFEGLANIIVSQQVSKASAAAISERLSNRIVPMDAQSFLKAGEPVWIEIGLSRPKQRAFENLCHAVLNGDLNLEAICDQPVEEAITQLTSVKGIGTWTAEVYLLFCVGHRDIFPCGDLALQEAVRDLLDLGSRPSEMATRLISKDWSPYRGIAARLLWAHYSNLKGGRTVLPL